MLGFKIGVRSDQASLKEEDLPRYVRAKFVESGGGNDYVTSDPIDCKD